MTTVSWRTPTVIITIGCLIALLTFRVRAGFGLFLEPMSSTLGWGREIFAFAIAVQNLLWGLGQPFAGALADRYGDIAFSYSQGRCQARSALEPTHPQPRV